MNFRINIPKYKPKLLIFFTVLIIALLSLSQLVYADYNGTEGGEQGHGTGDIGASQHNTGYFVYFAWDDEDQDGKPATNGFVLTRKDFKVKDTNFLTKEGQELSQESTVYLQSSTMPYPIISEDGKWKSNGDEIREWITADYNGVPRYQFLAQYAFASNPEALEGIKDHWEELAIVVQPVAILHTDGKTDRIATTDGWKEWLPNYSHSFVTGAMYNCMVLQEDKFGIEAPTVTSGLHNVSFNELQKTGWGIHIISLGSKGNSTQTTCDEPEQPAPHEAPNESAGTTTIIKNYRTYDKTKSTYTDDGVFVRENVAAKIKIEDEEEYKVVGWKTSTTTKEFIDSSKWEMQIPSVIMQEGIEAEAIELTAPETCLYVLLEKEEEQPEEVLDYNYKLTESSITRRIHLSNPDNQLALSKIQDKTFEWYISEHQASCSHNWSCGGCKTHKHSDGTHSSYCPGHTSHCSWGKWLDNTLKLSIYNTLKNNYPDILATKSGWNFETKIGDITKHWYQDGTITRNSTSAKSYPESNWDYVCVIMRGKDKLTLAKWKNEEVYPTANTDLRDASASGFIVANDDSGIRAITDYYDTFSANFENDGSGNLSTTYSVTAGDGHGHNCGSNTRQVNLKQPLSLNDIRVKVETYSGSQSAGQNDTSCNNSSMMTPSLSGFNVSSGKMVPSGGSVTFNPYVQMKYDTLTHINKNAYVLGEYERTITPNDYAEISWNRTTEANLTLRSSQWSTHAQAIKSVSEWNIDRHGIPNGNDSVLPGGAAHSLVIKKDDRQKVQVTTYQCIMKGAGRVQAEHTGSITGLEESAAVLNHKAYVESVKNALENTNVQQFVERKPDASNAFGGVEVNPDADISELNNGAAKASTEKKYYFRNDATTAATNEGDLDVHEGGTQTTYYVISSDTKGNILLDGEQVLAKNQGIDSLYGKAKMLDERTYVVRKLVAAIERNAGNDATNTWTNSTWYNEAFDGITIIEQKTLLNVGYIQPTERTTVLDPKLIPQSTGQRTLFTQYFLSQYKIRDYSETYGQQYKIGQFKGADVKMKDMDYLYHSKKFWIPNVTTQDLH